MKVRTIASRSFLQRSSAYDLCNEIEYEEFLPGQIRRDPGGMILQSELNLLTTSLDSAGFALVVNQEC